MVIDTREVDLLKERLAARLLGARAAPDHWEGRLASSALATGTAALALALAARHGHHERDWLRGAAAAGLAWLVRHQNADGGWGDTTRSRSNISTTAIVWAVLGAEAAGPVDGTGQAVQRAAVWLRTAAGDLTPGALAAAVLRRYGRDRTFSVPILTVLALTGRLGDEERDAWRMIPQLPFELAALPHHWFPHLRLPVVSYALPALIAMGLVRHRLAPSRNPIARLLRAGVRRRTLRVLADIQPSRGGYLEATPLTSFVVMSLAAAGEVRSRVVDRGVRFLVESMRDDGSWPIDTHLATWVTTLAAGALADAGALAEAEAEAIGRWLINQQSVHRHPFTHAAAGAWSWTPLEGGVPDADDTSGALLALRRLTAHPDARAIASAAAGLRWLLDLQNRDGGVPTFCRGWGTLPFDRSTPDITAHALQAWSAWASDVAEPLRATLVTAAARAVHFLRATQRPEGAWAPLWFGNEAAPDEENLVYGTSRVLLGLQSALARQQAPAVAARRRAIAWLLESQQPDGGWGGAPGVPATIEETGVALSALAQDESDTDRTRLTGALARGIEWLAEATTAAELPAAPIGLYFARLWYFEPLYPAIFALAGVAAVSARRAPAST